MSIVLAVVLGTAFGFALHRAGASDPQLIVQMLRLRDLHLMRTILLAIGVASGLLFLGLALGVLDPGHLSIKTTTWGVVVGGLLLGAGWALAGYCPGTAVAAIGDGRKDGLAYVLGGLVGAFAYMLAHSAVAGTGLLAPLFGGDVTLAATPTDSPALLGGLPGWLVAVVVAAAFALVAWKLPATTGPAEDDVGSHSPASQTAAAPASR